MYNFSIKNTNIFNLLGRAKAICITTNGVVKNNGCLVMGAGVAKQAVQHFPGIDKILGSKVQEHGNRVYLAGTCKGTSILSFPTKYHYKNNSDLNLIEQSAKRLVYWADVNNISETESIYIPAPGVGLGGLNKDTVLNALNKYLDSRFVVCFK